MRILVNSIQKELDAMCSLKSPSMLRRSDLFALSLFSWEDFNTKVEKTAPNLFALLNGILHVHSPPSQRKRRKSDKLCRVNKNAILGFCAALLCRYRNQSMNLVQRLISLVLYRGGANKQVHVRAWSFCTHIIIILLLRIQTFTRLQKLLVCLSHKRTVAHLVKLGEGYDSAALEWKHSILNSKVYYICM